MNCITTQLPIIKPAEIITISTDVNPRAIITKLNYHRRSSSSRQAKVKVCSEENGEWITQQKMARAKSRSGDVPIHIASH